MARTIALPASVSGRARYELGAGEAFTPTEIAWRQAVGDPASFSEPAFPQVVLLAPSGDTIAVLEAPYLTFHAPLPVRPVAESHDSYSVNVNPGFAFEGMPYTVDSDAADPFTYDPVHGTWVPNFTTEYSVDLEAVITITVPASVHNAAFGLSFNSGPAPNLGIIMTDTIDGSQPPGAYPISDSAFVPVDPSQTFTLFQIWGNAAQRGDITGTIVWTELTPPYEPYVVTFVDAPTLPGGIVPLDTSNRLYLVRGRLPEIDLVPGCVIELGTIDLNGNVRAMDEVLDGTITVEDAAPASSDES